MRILLPLVLVMTLAPMSGATAPQDLEMDLVKTSGGDLRITFIGHGSLMFQYQTTVIHVDPFGRLTDYSRLPAADLVLITHEHGDHLDLPTLRQVRKEQTTVIIAEGCAGKVDGSTVMKNGDARTVSGITIEAVPAYNIVQKRENGELFHPVGRGNGYVLTFGKTRVYIAGDTENTPEMKALRGIDVAFLPMNLPYTMTPEMVADAARNFRPAVLYPYHFGETDPRRLLALLKDQPNIEIRIRRMK
jgi:L-ascorbate metabolism protein UlaG (beta-lactamase superfamily)